MRARLILLLALPLLCLAAVGFLRLPPEAPLLQGAAFGAPREGCLLCGYSPLTDLAILYAGRHDVEDVPLRQYDETGAQLPSAAYMELSLAPPGEEIAFGYAINAGRYGVLEGEVILGADPAPDPARMEGWFCEECQRAILLASPGADILLADYANRRVYNLGPPGGCAAFGPYLLETHPLRDGRVGVRLSSDRTAA